MKFWLVFALMKVVEILAIVYVPYRIGCWFNNETDYRLDGTVATWFTGIVVTLTTAVVLVVGTAGIMLLVKTNMYLSGWIAGGVK